MQPRHWGVRAQVHNSLPFGGASSTTAQRFSGAMDRSMLQRSCRPSCACVSVSASLSVCLCLWSRRLWAGVLALSCAHSFWLLLLLLLFGLAGSALTQAVHLGTNAVHLKDRAVYLAVLHLKPTAGRREYINLPYLFEDKPPFRILRVARHPLQLSRGTRQQGFVFASSLALIDEDCLVVGYTVNDRTSSFLKTSLDLLLTQQFLSSVQQR